MEGAEGATIARRDGWIRRHRLAVVASAVVALGFAWLLHAGALPVVPQRAALRDVRLWTVAGHALIFLAALYVRAHRWSWLLQPLHPVPLRRVIAVSFIGMGAQVILPFRAGEVVRPALIRKRGHLSGWAAMGTVAAERIIEGLVLTLILLAALQVARPPEPLPDRIGDLEVPVALVPTAAYSALALFIAAFTAIGLFWWRRAWARRLVDATLGRVAPRLAGRVADALGHLADGLGFLPQASTTARVVAATVLYYVLYAAAVQLLVWGVGLEHASFSEACAIMGVLHLGVLVPGAPGYFGAFQISCYAGLAMYYSPAEVTGPGAALVFFLYLVQVSVTLLSGAVGLVAEHVSAREALEA